MKTKHLFLAMALPVAFAACTSEEIIENTQTQNLNARKALGDVELVFDNGVESRMTAEGGNIGFVVGDGVGACLVDVYSPTGDEEDAAIENYKLTSYIQTNYQYKRDEAGNWTTTARMVEGNYMFYAPYNGEHLERTSIMTGIPTIQNLDLTEDGTIDKFSALDEFLKSGKPAYVGYKFLEAENQDLKISVNMKPIYAYPEITIDNTELKGSDAEDLTITKVVIMNNGGFATEAPLAIGTADAKAAAGTGVVGKLYNYGTHDATKNAHGDWVLNKKNMVGNKTADVVGDAKETNNVVTINMPQGAYTIKSGETVSFNVVLPAANYFSSAFKAYAYTNEGTAIEVPMTANLSAGKIYADSRYNADGNFNGNKIDPLKIAYKNSNLPAAPSIVYSTTELKDLIASASENIAAITFANDDVKLTTDVVDAAANTNLVYGFASPVSIVGGTAEEPLVVSSLRFAKDVTIESGVVTWKENTDSKIIVKAGATLTINNGKDGGVTVANIENYGTVNVADVVEASAVLLKSNSALNVTAADNKQSDLKIDFAYEKTDADGNAVGGALNLAAAYAVDAALSIDAGTATTIGGVVTVTNTLTNNGSMTNNGTIKGEGTFKNTEDAELTNKGAIVTATVENDGTVDNEKYFGLNSDGNSTISKNTGVINMKAKTARVHVTAGDGEIDNTKLGKVSTAYAVGATEKNIITVTIDADMKNFGTLKDLGVFTKLYLNGGTWTIDNEQHTTAITVNNNGYKFSNWFNLSESTSYGDAASVFANMTNVTLVMNGGNINLVNKTVTFAAIEVTGTSTVYGDDVASSILNSTAVIRGTGSLSAEFAQVLGADPSSSTFATTVEDVTLWIANASNSINLNWSATDVTKTTTLKAVKPSVVRVASSYVPKFNVSAGSNVTFSVTGLALASTSYDTKADMETAIAALAKPDYLTATTLKLSGTFKMDLGTVAVGTGSAAKNYSVVAVWDASKKVWKLSSMTEL